jgi:hypothetical protein
MKGHTRIFATLLALLIAGATFVMPVQAGDHRGPPEHIRKAFIERHNPERIERVRNAIKAQERHQRSLMSRPGIVGTAVSWDENGDTVVKIYTDRHSSAAGLPFRVDGIKVVVEQVGKIYAQNIPCEQREGCTETPLVDPLADGQPATQRMWHPRPVPIGISSGHVDVTAGTLACRVTNGCHTYALSNAHVYADENDGLVDDNILQPGPTDGGVDPDDTIGFLFTSVPIVMSPAASNEVDAAIIETTTDLVGTATRTNGYGEPISVDQNTALDPDTGMLVMKYGRTTAQSYGYIDAINATVFVGYTGGTARFVNQIIIKEDLSIPQTRGFSRAGDSGSLIVGRDGAIDRVPVGLLFASGTESGTGVAITIANPIKAVLEAFYVKIDGE